MEIVRLAELLAKCTRVKQFDRNDELESWALAHGLSDIAESMRIVKDKLLPELYVAYEDERIEELLHDMGEEFRHILYHLKTSRFYRYLQEESGVEPE